VSEYNEANFSGFDLDQKSSVESREMTSVDISFTLIINVGLGLILSSGINHRKYLDIFINLQGDYNAEKLEWSFKSRCTTKESS
jgi:hypothetical protein